MSFDIKINESYEIKWYTIGSNPIISTINKIKKLS
jgi:hypothetical protein